MKAGLDINRRIFFLKIPINQWFNFYWPWDKDWISLDAGMIWKSIEELVLFYFLRPCDWRLGNTRWINNEFVSEFKLSMVDVKHNCMFVGTHDGKLKRQNDFDEDIKLKSKI